MIEVGKSYYIISHAYHHFLGEVTEVTPRHVTLKNCVCVYSCRRGWGAFFAEGLKDDTVCERFPDGHSCDYKISYTPWEHPTLPKGMM